MKMIAALLALFLMAPAWAGKCTVTEYVALPRDGQGNILYIGTLSPTTPSQTVTYTTSTKTTTALASTTNYVRVYCDDEARVAAGSTSITAVAGSTGLPAGGWEYFFVPKLPDDAARYVAIYDGIS